MAASSLLALIDDIATILDDVSVLSKVAIKKTSGVLGDDLALNAEQVSGVKAERELPVVWAVAKGSFKNKLILVPAALLISAVMPALITPLLMLGGGYLCYESFEKIAHSFLHSAAEDRAEHKQILEAVADPDVDLVQLEEAKIKGAIRTDFILSAEIIVISLGTVKEASFSMQVAVVSMMAVLMTVAVYGLVAGIVKLDDAGFYLIRQDGDSLKQKFKRLVGQGLLSFAPFLMKSLSVIGTIAMFLVGGGILLHGFHFLEPLVHYLSDLAATVPTIGSILVAVTPSLFGALLGVISGAILLVIVTMGEKFFHKNNTNES